MQRETLVTRRPAQLSELLSADSRARFGLQPGWLTLA